MYTRVEDRVYALTSINGHLQRQECQLPPIFLIFLLLTVTFTVCREEVEPVQSIIEDDESVREVRASPKPVPYVVQSGFNAPDGQGRLLFVFGTTTITTTSTTTTTASLTAACRSTTGYQVCNAFGK